MKKEGRGTDRHRYAVDGMESVVTKFVGKKKAEAMYVFAILIMGLNVQ